MKYSEFQRVIADTDPRGVLIFAAPFAEIMPYVVAQADGCGADVILFRSSTEIQSAATSVEGETGVATSQDRSFTSVVTECLDHGKFLVLPSLTQLDFNTWREVSKVLVLAVPEEGFESRHQFRLITFMPEGVVLPQVVPPLICQFAFIIDSLGEVRTRTQLGPIFENGVTTLSGFRGLSDFRQTQEFAETNQYVQLLLATMKTKVPTAQAKEPATSPTYIHEVLFTLREALLIEQQTLIADAAEADNLREVEAAEERQKKKDRLGDDYDEEAELIAEAQKKNQSQLLAETYDWIYHKILGWTVVQCPDADISSLPHIPKTDIVQLDILWQHEREVGYSATWNGCAVIEKQPLKSLHGDFNDAATKLFAMEAARHYSLRHPHVVSLYGIVGEKADSMVLEACSGTLEQALIQSRIDAKRWTIENFLRMAVDTLHGMSYLASVLIHRDISIRSILQAKTGEFKVGQFGCAIPIRHVNSDSRRGFVPVRWTAPEGFVGKFETNSDIWSFGVLLWQAFSYATLLPYREADYVPDAVIQGKILPPFEACPNFIYTNIILKCFVMNVQERPSPVQLLLHVQHLLRTLPPHILKAVVPFPNDNMTFGDFNKIKEELP